MMLFKANIKAASPRTEYIVAFDMTAAAAIAQKLGDRRNRSLVSIEVVSHFVHGTKEQEESCKGGSW